jgi:Leucine-rich repeat (LRR) protein
LNLAGNRLESLDDLSALQTIEALDVSNNKISNLAVGSVLQGSAMPSR